MAGITYWIMPDEALLPEATIRRALNIASERLEFKRQVFVRVGILPLDPEIKKTPDFMEKLRVEGGGEIPPIYPQVFQDNRTGDYVIRILRLPMGKAPWHHAGLDSQYGYIEGYGADSFENVVLFMLSHEVRHIWQYTNWAEPGTRQERERDADVFAKSVVDSVT